VIRLDVRLNDRQGSGVDEDLPESGDLVHVAAHSARFAKG
jgi:hypothetical protein